MTLLQAYEDKEQYEKAAIIKNKIEKIEIKLNKL
jgi:protein-arginine kinase activator protein McsA